MSDFAAMSQLLSVLLLVSGGLRLLRRTLCTAQGGTALPAAALLAGYGLLSAALCTIITRFAGAEMLLPALLLLVTLLTAAAALAGLCRLPGRVGLGCAVLLALWCAGVLLVTVLLRRAEEANILLRFDALPAILRQRSLEPLLDLLGNVLLFLPLGLLLPRADSLSRAAWLNVLSAALLMTAAIEGLQMLFQLGQADVEDLMANVLGALCGLGLHHLLRRSSPER
ncbi:MAG: VanZ family protein [Clostridia bacterium]|nr:VanZ family protein [Clostridia bacterium]